MDVESLARGGFGPCLVGGGWGGVVGQREVGAEREAAFEPRSRRLHTSRFGLATALDDDTSVDR